jgi:hypothetical protein
MVSATTDAPMVTFQVAMNITIASNADFEKVAEAMQPLLQSHVAPLVANYR